MDISQIAERFGARLDDCVRRDPVLNRIAFITGLIFIPAGLVKFVFHHWELHAFQSFGLPWPSALEIIAGVVEVTGGVLLMARRLIAPTGLVLATTMVVAIYSSGIEDGDIIPSLTLAPVLLIALVVLVVSGTTLRTDPRTSR